MLELALLDTTPAALAAMPERVRDALAAKATALAAELQARIQRKLSGEVLNMKSGALAGSITSEIDESSASISVRIATSADVKYAVIHEFGGAIPPHEIVPDKAKALAFVIGGKQTFAARVQMPTVTMPERSYMRSSLVEMVDEIKDALARVVVEVLD